MKASLNFPALGSCLMQPHTPRPQLRGGWGGLPSFINTHTIPHSTANERKRPRPTLSNFISRRQLNVLSSLSLVLANAEMFFSARKSFEPPGRARSASKSENPSKFHLSSPPSRPPVAPPSYDCWWFSWDDDWKERGSGDGKFALFTSKILETFRVLRTLLRF